MSRGPEFEELRDQLIQDMGLQNKAKDGFSHLTMREIGRIGGETNKIMVEKAKEHLSSIK